MMTDNTTPTIADDLLPPLQELRERLADRLEETNLLRGLIRLAERRAETRASRREVRAACARGAD